MNIKSLTPALALTLGIAAGSEGRASDVEAVRKAMAELNQAFNSRDVPAIKRLTTPGHVAVTRYTGRPLDLDQAISLLAEYKASGFRPAAPEVKMLDERTALVTFPAEAKATFRGREVPPRYFAAAVWVERGGEWFEAFYQETPITGD